jgi:hypothetical protein
LLKVSLALRTEKRALSSEASSPSAERPLDWVFHEHEEINYHLCVLENLLNSREALASKAWFAGLVSWFHIAVPRIEEQLRHEEVSSLYTSFAHEFPELARDLARLREEHETLNAIIRVAREQCETPSQALLETLAELLAFVRRHEQEETALIQRAYSEDLGGGR